LLESEQTKQTKRTLTTDDELNGARGILLEEAILISYRPCVGSEQINLKIKI